jgi:hypothetical protein
MVAAAVLTAAGVASASPDDGDGTPITGDALARASQVALDYTRGGTVSATALNDQEGRYQVEVTNADGSKTDVNMNDAFAIVSTKTEPAGIDIPDNN